MYDLLKLWKFCSQNFSMNELADHLQLSGKQTARNLKKYEQQGWLTYIPGKGRGNKSQILWHKNKEEIIEANLKDPKFRIEMLKKLNFDNLSDTTVTNIFSSLFFMNHYESHLLKIPIYNAPLMTNPMEVIDTESAWIISHLFSKLVDEQGEADLAFHWEERDSKFLFFIRPNVYWHNGELMKMCQVFQSLRTSFQHENFSAFQDKLKTMDFNNNCIIFDYEGSLTELLFILGQIEFCIQYEKLSSGAFELKQIALDQYLLSVNKYYYLEKPLIPNMILQTIPSQLTRKISLANVHEIDWVEKREHEGTFYLYYKTGFSRQLEKEINEFFHYFAKEVSNLDDSKIATHTLVNENVALSSPLKIGYMVNKEKFINLLMQVGDHAIQVDHLCITNFINLETLSKYDCLILPMYSNSNAFDYRIEKIQSIFHNKIPLYESYRKMYYPKTFTRKGLDIYGYPNLRESFLIN